MAPEPAPSGLTLELTQTGDVAVFRCTGALVAGNTEFLYTEVKKLIPASKQIVLDLTDLAYMDSMGIGTVIRLYVSGKKSGCDLKLINLGKRVREVLGVTHLLSVFAIVGEGGGVRMP